MIYVSQGKEHAANDVIRNIYVKRMNRNIGKYKVLILEGACSICRPSSVVGIVTGYVLDGPRI